MRNNLFLIQNLMIFMEECFVFLPKETDFFTINPYYVKNLDTLSSLKKDINRLFPSLKFISYSNIFKSPWNNILMSSYAPEMMQQELNTLDANEIILVEDGLFDYISGENNYLFYKNKDLYLFRPQLASLQANQSHVNALIVTDNVINRFNSVFSKEISELSQLNPKTPVLFTTPLNEDFGSEEIITKDILSYIERTFSPERMVIKKHPRDTFEYKSNSIEIVECNQNIPGQLLDRIFDGLKIFLFPSTVSFMCGELSDIVFLNVMPDNKKYSEAFKKITESELFYDQKQIKIRSIR